VAQGASTFDVAYFAKLARVSYSKELLEVVQMMLTDKLVSTREGDRVRPNSTKMLAHIKDQATHVGEEENSLIEYLMREKKPQPKPHPRGGRILASNLSDNSNPPEKSIDSPSEHREDLRKPKTKSSSHGATSLESGDIRK